MRTHVATVSRACVSSRADAGRCVQAARASLVLGLALTGFAAPGFAQDSYRQTVVVTAAATPATLDATARPLRVIGRAELDALPVSSVADALRLIGAVDVRARGPRGVQTDFSLRGGGFGQTLVLVDGVRLNDPQSGHHNGDIPVPLDAVERIEVLPGPGSSLFGADAFGGTINIVTRAASRTGRLEVHGGTFASAGGAAAVGGRRGALAARIDASFDRSGGFVADRDFRSVLLSSRVAIGERTTVGVSLFDREFGAFNFYGGGVPSREWTDGLLLTGAHQRQVDGWRVAVDGAYRMHGDRFVFDRRAPAISDNRHRTHSVSARGVLSRAVRGATLAFGGESGIDSLVSSSLGDHDVTRVAGFVEWRQPVGGRLLVSGAARVDRYTEFGHAWSPSIAAGWWATPHIRLRASAGRAFRVPTFTERFYRAPLHVARPDVGPERAWAGDAGVDLFSDGWNASVTAFGRADRDVIDWLRDSPADDWMTTNIRSLATRGLEVGLRRRVGAAFVTAEYAALAVEAPAVTALSKYTLDYARHSLVGGAAFPTLFGVNAAPRLEYRRRVRTSGTADDVVLDLRVTRPAGALFQVAVDGTNLLGDAYEEVPGVLMPGRGLMVRLIVGGR